MFWLVELAIVLGTAIAQLLLAPRQRRVNNLSPNSLAQFNVPTNEQGTPIPYVAGTVLIDAPAVLWDGDYHTSPIVQSDTVVGYKYFVGLQLGLCTGPIDELVEIRFDGKALPGGPIWVSPDDDALVMIDGETVVAHLPQGAFADPHALAVGATAAINMATGRPAGYFRVWFGHQVVAGGNDILRYSVRESGSWRSVEVTIPVGDYGRSTDFSGGHLATTYELASAVAEAINAAEAGHAHRVTVACAIDDLTHLCTFTVSPGSGPSGDSLVTGFRVHGQASGPTINLCLGIHHNEDIELEVVWSSGHDHEVSGTFTTQPGRYLFGGGPAGSFFAFSRAESNSAPHFGVTGTYDYAGTGALGENAINFFEHAVTYESLSERVRATVDVPDHFGAGDGVYGTIDVYLGSQTQEADPYLLSAPAIGPPLPAYRGVSYAVLNRFYMGNLGQFRPVSFVLRRCPDPLGLGPAVSNLNGDANPALLIYDLLTSPLFQQDPIAADCIETEDFVSAALQLAREGLGYSRKLDSAGERGEHIADVLRHIDAIRYTDPTTSRVRLKLIRADYAAAALPRFDRGNVLSCEYTQRSWGDTKNIVKVTYCDRSSGFTSRVVQAIDAANVEAQQGSTAIENVSFEGISSETLARWVAERMLKTLSYPGHPLTLTVDRSAERLRPGDALVLDWEPAGIAGLVLRVARVSLGTIRAPEIRVEAIEDIWGTDDTVYTAPAVTRWHSPRVAPHPVAAQRLEEAPYTLAGGAQRRVMALGARGAGAAHGFQSWTDPAGGTAYVRSNPAAEFTPTALLVGLMGFASEWLTVHEGIDLGQLKSATTAERDAGRNLLLVDDEWMAWQTIVDNGDGTVTFSGLVRGVLDTVPAMHETGARVWFPSQASPVLDEVDRPADFTAAAKLAPTNQGGVLALASATRATLTTASRALRPYPPTAVRINGAAYPDAISGDLVLAWIHRDRLGAWSFADAGAAAAAEPGATYTVRIYDESNALVHEETGLAGTGLTYVHTSERWRVVVLAVLPGAIESQQVFDYTIGTNHGWGLAWGRNWGGYRAS